MSSTSLSFRLGPDDVRSLRGGLSRAAFAKRLGVTPHTVYRWELPDGAKEARRPRGPELERLEHASSQPHGTTAFAGSWDQGDEPRRPSSRLPRIDHGVDRFFIAPQRRATSPTGT